MEFRFRPGPIAGDPYDPETGDVRVVLSGPGGLRRLLPAFHDGEGVWAVRHTPERDGTWRVVEVRLGARRLRVPLPPPATIRRPDGALRFARRHPRLPTRFADDRGQLLWPIGHNTAWSSDTPKALIRQLESMAAAGLDWTRIWMCHWDGKNLDWPADPGGASVSLAAARRWDAIVAAAERLGIRLQMVLQHHGQISTRTNPNWDDHPWNRRNGGFLASPVEFFTHPEALRRTRAKFRYAVARWGYSPAIFAWELFNEVEWVDAIVDKRPDIVAAWHRDMAATLRSIDPWRHMVTTSSDRGIPGLYDAMDFVQPHAYPPDAVAAVRSLVPVGKPAFFGEIGPGAFALDREDGRFLEPALWAGIATQESGAPQYWTWETIEHNRLYPWFRSAAGFVKASRLAAMTALAPRVLEIETDRRGRIAAGPGLSWADAATTRFPVLRDGTIEGIGAMPAYLQGDRHRAKFPEAEFAVDVDAPATVRIRFSKVSQAGATPVLTVDEREIARRALAPSGADQDIDVELSAPLAPGHHRIRVRNQGVDWIVVAGIAIDPYGPALRALGRGNDRHVVAWITRTIAGDDPVEGVLRVPGLAPGRYVARVWDIAQGRPTAAIPFVAVRGRPSPVPLPPVSGSVGVWVEPS